MRLRYLHLRNYSPIEDIALCFRAPVLKDRECSIRFVVGINGSGKTHLLQAIAETFLALARQQRPHFPVTLAWELGEGERRRTLIFDNPGQGQEVAWWQSDQLIEDTSSEENWDELITELRSGNEAWRPLIDEGNWPGKGTGLPMTVLTYTTGNLEPWQRLFDEPPSADVDSQLEDYDMSLERPVGWSLRQELDYQASQGTEESLEVVQNLQELAEEASVREHEQDVCLLLTPTLLKFALLAVSLRQAMQEYRQYTTDEDVETFKQNIRDVADTEQTGLRRLLSQVGWLWPVSVVFHIDFNLEAWSESERQQKGSILKALYILANEVVRDPEPSTQRRLFFDLKSPCQLDEYSRQADYADIIDQFFGGDEFNYVGDALQEFISRAETSPFEGFNRLVNLHQQGLLTDIQIAVCKADIDDLLLFDELSDGEQVYLGRMALFHLLAGEHDALLILDEPEVHFNDKWKREIVDIIDDVLKEKANDVLIATHSSISLTGVFNDEIILLDKRDGHSVPVEIRSTTFGADPSEVMVRLFQVPDSIENRAMEWLDEQIDREWSSADLPELQWLLEKVGPGFHRSELRGILRRLRESAT
jgi:ABC-type transport system involved in cytochrome c biogenesis ATPase subunit